MAVAKMYFTTMGSVAMDPQLWTSQQQLTKQYTLTDGPCNNGHSEIQPRKNGTCNNELSKYGLRNNASATIYFATIESTKMELETMYPSTIDSQ